MDAVELARWTRFAAKGGIGKCTAVQDCVAKQVEDLMFFEGDEIIVLMQLPDHEGVYLGYCEGVVGRFQGAHVHLHSKLKKPVMTKRHSTTTSKASSSKSTSPHPTSRARETLPAPSKSPISLMTSPSSTSLPNLNPVMQPVDPNAESLPSSISPSRAISPAIPLAGNSPVSRISKSSLEVPQLVTQSPERSIRHTADVEAITAALSDSIVPMGSPESRPSRTVQPDDDMGSSSLHLPRDSMALLNAQEAGDDHPEPSTRISAAMSDGEVGIGLSLLQDLIMGSGDLDEWSSSASGRSSRSETHTQESPVALTTPQDLPATSSAAPSTSSAQFQSHPSPSSSQGASSGKLRHGSQSESGVDDWEDIYDDYRYSRQSSASKASRASMLSTNTGSKIPPPPMPSEFVPESRPSMDGKQSTESDYSFYNQSTKLSNLSTTPDKTLPASESISRLPAPLDLSAARHLRYVEDSRSPLLHNAFGSAVSSPEATVSSVSSPPFNALTYPPSPGAASALRQRFDIERMGSAMNSTQPETTHAHEADDLHDRGIVIDDDEDLVPNVVHESPEPVSPNMSPSTSSSPEPEVALARLPPLAIANPTPTPSPSATPHPPSPAPEHAPAPLEQISPPEQTNLTSTPRSENESTTHPRSDSNMALHSENNATVPRSELEPVLVAPNRSELEARHPPNLLLSPAPQATEDPNQPAPQRRPSTEPPQPQSRESLFLPHPNAPKPTPTPSAPMYARLASVQPSEPQNLNHENSSSNVIHAAITLNRHLGFQKPFTIYGRCETDLANSTKPVPIKFFLEPPESIPAQNTNRTPYGVTRPATAPEPPNADKGIAMGVVGDRRSPVPVYDTSAGKVIPRANFFPKSQTSRPRSRSFSGFDAEAALIADRSFEEGSSTPKARAPRSPPSRSSTVGSPPLSSKPISKPSPLRSSHSPSPLSRPENSVTNAQVPTRVNPGTQLQLSTGLAQPPTTPSATTRAHQLRKVTSASTIENAPPPASWPLVPTPLPVQRAVPTSDPKNPISSRDLSSPAVDSRTSVDTTASQQSEYRAQAPSPAPEISIARRPSLRSKLSLPNLRGSSSTRQSSLHGETMQVKDMDFELIRPSMLSQDSGRRSEESNLTRSGSFDTRPDLVNGNTFLRTDSPPVSISSGGLSGSPTISEGPGFSSNLSSPKTSDSQQSMEAHRQRELKWVHIMSSVPAAQARKNKKVKKLIFEGVPSSVRYLVWAHLMNSKARAIPGIYSQLVQRSRVPSFSNIERDVRKCFADQPHLQTTQGPLLSLLQAYLTMVPDIQYYTGLTLVAGHLLLLAPEEDAFWIFVSLMDIHLRPYFSLNIIQMEVDSSLFSQALEAVDGPVAKKILVTFGLPPAAICRPWFSSLFSGTLPAEYLHRVWDIALYEGLPFLLRVGLCVASCCRRQILEATSDDVLIELLMRPPPVCFPPSPDAFLARAFSIKLKDDDMRKQRSKMENQLKRQTQSRTMSVAGAPTSISTPRS